MFAKATIFIAFLTAYATALTVPEVAERDEFSSSASMMKRDSYSGDGTWYNTGLSACGTYDVSHTIFSNKD